MSKRTVGRFHVQLLLLRLIGLYQKTLSPDHGPLKGLYEPYGFCRHEPTCSQYAKEVIARRGAIFGVWLTSKRLLTCHPWRQPSIEKITAVSLRSD